METHFLASGNHFLLLPQMFFKMFFIPASGNTFFCPEKKYCFLLRTFSAASTSGNYSGNNGFHYSGNHYLNYKEAYLKLLSLLLATILFDFLEISANVYSFFV